MFMKKLSVIFGWIGVLTLIAWVGALSLLMPVFLSGKSTWNAFWNGSGVFIYSGTFLSSNTGAGDFFTGSRMIDDIGVFHEETGMTLSGNTVFLYGEYPKFFLDDDRLIHDFLQTLSDEAVSGLSDGSWSYLYATYTRLSGQNMGSIVYRVEERGSHAKKYAHVFLINHYGAMFFPRDLLHIDTPEAKNAFSVLLQDALEEKIATRDTKKSPDPDDHVLSENMVSGFLENPQFAFSGENVVFYFPSVQPFADIETLTFPYASVKSYIVSDIAYLVTKKDRPPKLEKKFVALSFDDGPNDKTTPGLLDILKEKGVKATFFVIGKNVEHFPEIIAREVAEGHVVGNHTMTHPDLTKLNLQDLHDQILQNDALIAKAWNGYKTELIRPPYGAYNEFVRENVWLWVVYWSVDTDDWKTRNTKKSIDTVLANLHDGAIILFHDIYPESVAAIGPLIDQIRARWYELVTIPELYELYHGKNPEDEIYPGQICFSALNCR